VVNWVSSCFDPSPFPFASAPQLLLHIFSLALICTNTIITLELCALHAESHHFIPRFNKISLLYWTPLKEGIGVERRPKDRVKTGWLYGKLHWVKIFQNWHPSALFQGSFWYLLMSSLLQGCWCCRVRITCGAFNQFLFREFYTTSEVLWQGQLTCFVNERFGWIRCPPDTLEIFWGCLTYIHTYV